VVGALTARTAGRRPLLTALAAAFLLSGCAVFDPEETPSPPPSPVISGIRGTVLLGPTCEGATRADACTEPYAARLIILDADGTPVGEASSGADGLFEIVLPPGVYTIQPVPPEGDALFPVAFPVSVVVGEEEWTEVGIDYDTGIR